MLAVSAQLRFHRRSAIASRVLVFMAALVCAGRVVSKASAWFAYYESAIAFAMVCAGTGAALVLACCALRLPDRLIRRVAIELTALGCALVVVELLIGERAPESRILDPVAASLFARQRAAERIGVPFDGRSISEKVADLRARGIDALPRVTREWPQYLHEQLPGGIYPLSHASNATVVECNEGGEYLVYQTDEFGFNNPPGLVASRDIEIAVIGESLALGYCLPAEQSMVGRLRRAHPRTANFSLAGTRPLSQLAAFREYIEPLRPAVVVWTVNAEYAHPMEQNQDSFLLRYLDPHFLQHLSLRQDEVDAIVRKLIPMLEARSEQQIRAETARAERERFISALKLPLIRRHLGPGERWSRWARAAERSEQFELVLRLARDTLAQWNGQLVVVLLPTYEEVVNDQAVPAIAHDHLAERVRALGITVIDGTALFKEQTDPAALFTFRMNGHPTGSGHRLLAERLIAKLDTLLP